MAGNDAEFKTFVDARQAEAEIVKLHKRIDQLSGRLKGAGKTSKAAADEGARGWKEFNSAIDRAVLKGGGLATIFSMAGRAASKAAAEGSRLQDIIQQTANMAQENELKLQIQAGLTPAAVEKQLPAIRNALMATPSASHAEAILLQTQLASSGFNQEDIKSGAALKTTLDLKAATNQFGKEVGDPKAAVLAVSQMVKALGEDIPTAASIRRVGGKLTETFALSDVQFTDLRALAVKSAGLKALNVNEDTQLAAFSALTDVMGGELAATALDQVTIGLRAAASTPKTKGALKKIGLKPEDVDLIGETLPEALDKLKKGMSGVDEKTGSLAMIDLFGERAAKSAFTAMEVNERTKMFLGLMGGNAFERNVANFQNSVFARRSRTRLKGEFSARDEAMLGDGLTWEELGEQKDSAILQARKNAGPVGKFLLNTASWMGSALNWFDRDVMGRTPADAGYRADYSNPNGGNQGMEGAMRENNRLMQEQNDMLRKQEQNRPPINRNAHTEK